ncbi:glycosyltransferase [Castellaniella sp.]|uniref:glycosyltransferase n=1 Tax=Castellaniella sp. TaxID=1955812 RepID=UPI003C794CD8
MNLLILTYGTEGDTSPLIVLGHALRAAGNTVHILGDARTLGLAHQLGVPASPLAGDVRKLHADWGRTGAKGAAKSLVKLANEQCDAWMRDALAAAEGCDAVVTSGLAGFVGLSVAERLKVPVIGAGMIPLTPSREFPSPFLPSLKIPGWANRASLALTNQLLWLAFRGALNQARADVLGLPPRKALWNDHPMLYGISPTVLPRPVDWPATAHLCGQWMLPTQSDYEPSPDLARFLAAGEAPVYMGFGSMTGIDMPKIVDAAVTALDGRRAVFSGGWNGMHDAGLPDTILRVDRTPHDWLFPRMAAIIHHGGSGTTHSALRAGRPSIVMPFVGDQPFWAARLRHLGVAPAAVSPARPDPKALAAALRFVGRESVVKRAQALGRHMAQEDGLAAGVKIVMSLLERSTRLCRASRG